MVRILEANRFVSKGGTRHKGLRKGSTTVTAKRRHAEAFDQKTEAILRQAELCTARKRGMDMFYICEFEFYDDGEGSVAALCLNDWGGATFGDDLEDAGESAADWLTCMVDDCLMNGRELPPVELGHEPQHGGMAIALAVSRELSNIPAMTAADAARKLGVSTARVTQLANAGLLDSWKEGSRRMVSKASVEARLEDAPKAGRPKTAMA